MHEQTNFQSHRATHKVLVGPEVLIVIQRSLDVSEFRLIVADPREENDGDDVVRFGLRPAFEESREEAMLLQREESRISKRFRVGQEASERITKAFS